MLKSVEICYICLLPYTLGIPSRENKPEKEDLNFFSSRNVSFKNKNIMWDSCESSHLSLVMLCYGLNTAHQF